MASSTKGKIRPAAKKKPSKKPATPQRSVAQRLDAIEQLIKSAAVTRAELAVKIAFAIDHVGKAQDVGNERLQKLVDLEQITARAGTRYSGASDLAHVVPLALYEKPVEFDPSLLQRAKRWFLGPAAAPDSTP